MEHLAATWGNAKLKSRKVGVTRYADDFVISACSKELLEEEIRPWVEAFLAKRGLRLAAAKTAIVNIDEGFDFLGWNFRKYSGTLLIKPSKKNVKAFYEKVRDLIGSALALKQADLIGMLNPILRGWAQYHHPVVAKETFSRMDSLLNWRLMRWAKRRHPRKSADWIRQKYWRTIGNRHWVFAADVSNEDGSKRVRELFSLSSMPIERHTKIKGGYNPYDPAWEMYGETLRQNRMSNSMRFRVEWVKLYVCQHGKCALCGYEIDFDSGWHDHHIEYRVAGGSDVLGNRVLLHPNCHTQVHHFGLKVVKPASV